MHDPLTESPAEPALSSADSLIDLQRRIERQARDLRHQGGELRQLHEDLEQLERDLRS